MKWTCAPQLKLYTAATEYEGFKEGLKMVIDGKADRMPVEYPMCVVAIYLNQNKVKGA
jgi:hypothetical protein